MPEIPNLGVKAAEYGAVAQLARERALVEKTRMVRTMGDGLVVLAPCYGVEGVVHISKEEAANLD